MIEKILKVLLSLILMLALSGCFAVAERDGPPAPAPVMADTIVIFPYGKDGAFWREFRKGAAVAAEKEGYRIQWEWPPPVWNPNRQGEMMREMLELNPPGIILAPLHRNRMQAALVATVKKAIPVVVAATNEDTSFKVSYVGSEHEAIGRDLAEVIGTRTPPDSNVVIVNVQAGMRSVDLSKHQLLQELSRSFPNLTISETQFATNKDLNYAESHLQIEIADSLKEYLKQHTDVTSVVTLDENSTKAAWKVLETLSGNKRPLLFGVSVEPELIEHSQKGEIAALVVQDARQIGEKSVQAVVGYREGERLPEQVIIPYKIVQAES